MSKNNNGETPLDNYATASIINPPIAMTGSKNTNRRALNDSNRPVASFALAEETGCALSCRALPPARQPPSAVSINILKNFGTILPVLRFT